MAQVTKKVLWQIEQKHARLKKLLSGRAMKSSAEDYTRKQKSPHPPDASQQAAFATGAGWRNARRVRCSPWPDQRCVTSRTKLRDTQLVTLMMACSSIPCTTTEGSRCSQSAKGSKGRQTRHFASGARRTPDAEETDVQAGSSHPGPDQR